MEPIDSDQLERLNIFQRTKLMATMVGALVGKLLYHGPKYIIYPVGTFGTLEKQPPWNDPARYEEVFLKTKDKAKIKCYFMTWCGPRPTIMICHGNTGGVGGVSPLAHLFYLMGCHVFLFSYRGYGYSTGRPCEKGIRIDAQTALDYILSHPLVVKYKQDEQPKVVLYGVSLGGAVALDLASRNADSILALIIENTFRSIPRMISELFPSPRTARFIRFLCREKWDNETAIAGLPSDLPLLMLSGLQDEVIPAAHMKELWSIFQRRSPTRAVWQEFPLGGHNDLSENVEYGRTLLSFLTNHVPVIIEEEP